MAKKEASFEENLEKLRKIVDDLESGNIPLKESMNKFKEGTEIIKQCHNELQEAELKVDILINKDGAVSRESYKKF